MELSAYRDLSEGLHAGRAAQIELDRHMPDSLDWRDIHGSRMRRINHAIERLALLMPETVDDK